MSEDIKDIKEILELAKEEIENNNENITATLDLQDLKSLKNLYDLYNKQNKIIDKMADEIYDLGQKQDMRNDNITIWIDKEHILNYFTKLVEEKSK